jgi:hypothetical protein
MLPQTAGVSDDYRHVSKLITASEDLVLPDVHLKWYDVRREGVAIPEDVRSEAREFVRAETASGRLAISGELGFVVLHLCGDSFYFLIVCTWRNDNELWETAYQKDTKDADPFRLVPKGDHMAVMCVWELGALLHERQAWTRYLYSARDDDARLAYVGDRFAGPA